MPPVGPTLPNGAGQEGGPFGHAQYPALRSRHKSGEGLKRLQEKLAENPDGDIEGLKKHLEPLATGAKQIDQYTTVLPGETTRSTGPLS